MASVERYRVGIQVRYRARWRDPASNSKSKSGFELRRDAEIYGEEQEHSIRAGGYVDPQAGNVRFGEWAKRWYGTTVHLKASTRKVYDSLLRTHVLPEFEHVPLNKIDRMMIKTFYGKLLAKGLSPSRANAAHFVVVYVLDAAVENAMLVKNPAKDLDLKQPRTQEMLCLNATQVEALTNAIDPHYSLLIRFAAYTGMRAGEIGALRVRRINFLRGRVVVAESLAHVNGERHTWQTKNNESRVVTPPRFLVEQLREHCAGKGPDDLVFVTKSGREIRHNVFYADYFKPAVQKAKLNPRLRFHDLRHTCASLLIDQGAHPKMISAHLGHKSIAITMDRYGHLFEEHSERLAEMLDATYQAAAGIVCDPRAIEPIPMRRDTAEKGG